MKNIKITLKLYGGLDKYFNNYNYQKGISLRLNFKETKIIDILKKFRIPKRRITLVMVGDKIIGLDYVVKNGDLIKIFSYIGGG